MAPSLNVMLIATAGAAAIAVGLRVLPSPPDATDLVTVGSGGSFNYRASGEYLRDGVAVNAPRVPVAFARPIAIMKRQVSRAEYRRCVEAGDCKPAEEAATGAADTLPVVGVSWNDATAYAAWLSDATGHRYRLPTDSEWAFAAGERYHDDALAVDGDARDPAKRWLKAYEAESAVKGGADPSPHPFGTFGTNGKGLLDIAGNVWEWTDSCYVRHATHSAGTDTAIENCGVRVVEGSHRIYMNDFIRDPRGGACSVGAPPSNLGIRLVRDDAGMFAPLVRIARRLGLWSV